MNINHILLGLIIGTAVGAGVGAAGGYGYAVSNNEEYRKNTIIEYGAGVGAGVGMIAMSIGMGIGVMVSDRKTYSYYDMEPPTYDEWVSNRNSNEEFEMENLVRRKGVKWPSNRSLEETRFISDRNLNERSGGGRKATWD